MKVLVCNFRPHSEGCGKVMFSVCSPGGGTPSSGPRSLPRSLVPGLFFEKGGPRSCHWSCPKSFPGGMPVLTCWGKGVPQPIKGVPPNQDWGTPPPGQGWVTPGTGYAADGTPLAVFRRRTSIRSMMGGNVFSLFTPGGGIPVYPISIHHICPFHGIPQSLVPGPFLGGGVPHPPAR